jgi:hypothetical protein
MPDRTSDLRARLAGLRLAPAREAEIVEELSQHMDDRYEELRAAGTSDPDARLTRLAELLQLLFGALADCVSEPLGNTGRRWQQIKRFLRIQTRLVLLPCLQIRVRQTVVGVRRVGKCVDVQTEHLERVRDISRLEVLVTDDVDQFLRERCHLGIARRASANCCATFDVPAGSSIIASSSLSFATADESARIGARSGFDSSVARNQSTMAVMSSGCGLNMSAPCPPLA